MSYNDYIDTVQKTAGIMLKAFGNSILTKKIVKLSKRLLSTMKIIQAFPKLEKINKKVSKVTLGDVKKIIKTLRENFALIIFFCILT